MTNTDIIRNRLINQQIAVPGFQHPQEIVTWLCAMQAQEFAMTKWSIGLRLAGTTDSMIEKAFNEGAILRTHLLRPTWHFVSPEDIRWLLELTAPRVNALNAYWYRKSELDNSVFKKANDQLIKMLQGGQHMTRAELQTGLKKKNIVADGLRLSYIMMKAELDGIICSGPRKGKQFTYALLEERVKPTQKLNRKEALALLGLRYFTSRGPATLQDFAVWSGLTVKDANEAAAALPSSFLRDGEYLFLPQKQEWAGKMQKTFLMPDYDEYGMSYKNRNAILPRHHSKIKAPTYNRMIVIDGKIAGSWRTVLNKKIIDVEVVPLTPVSKSQQSALKTAIKKYQAFIP